MSLVDQWVVPLGFSVSVLTMSASTSSSPNLRGTPGTGLVVQPVETVGGEAVPPLLDRGHVYPELFGHLGVAQAVGTRRHDPAPQGEGLLALRSPRPPFEGRSLVLTQHHFDRCGSSFSHRCLPSSLTTGATRTMRRKFPN